MDENEIIKLKEDGYLHDVGKIALDPRLLNNRFQLSTQDQNKLKKHTTVGYRILSSFDNTMDLAEPILTHHEHWDGSGYPKGLKENEIPLLARIIKVVESYDRMINCTDETQSLAKSEAIEMLKDKAGTKYDPAIIEAFVQMLEASRN